MASLDDLDAEGASIKDEFVEFVAQPPVSTNSSLDSTKNPMTSESQTQPSSQTHVQQTQPFQPPASSQPSVTDKLS